MIGVGKKCTVQGWSWSKERLGTRGRGRGRGRVWRGILWHEIFFPVMQQGVAESSGYQQNFYLGHQAQNKLRFRVAREGKGVTAWLSKKASTLAVFPHINDWKTADFFAIECLVSNSCFVFTETCEQIEWKRSTSYLFFLLTVEVSWAQICKRLRSLGIDSKESIPEAYV